MAATFVVPVTAAGDPFLAAGGDLRHGGSPGPWPYVWFWTEKARPALGDRKGQRCRVLARGTKNSALVEFESDGHKVITSRNALRKA
jgi:hypothetical protein